MFVLPCKFTLRQRQVFSILAQMTTIVSSSPTGAHLDRLARWMAPMALALLSSASGAAPEALAAKSGTTIEWPSYGGDYTEQRYSRLDAINTATVGRLGLEWALDLPNETGLVATPLLIGGTLYFTGKFSVVYAVNARTGRIDWTYDPKAREVLTKSHKRMTINWNPSRGVAYWQHRVYVAVADGRLIALSDKDGKELWSTQTFDPTTARLITGAPLAFNGKVLIGFGGGDLGPVRGYVTAYDARTGKRVWRFYTVPGNPADGFENAAMRKAAATWTGEWWKFGGGGAVWNSMTYDPEFNRVYIGTGNGVPWNQSVRSPGGGDNLFVASIVALDADSGRYAWHYQETPGDDWDYDATVDMVLADIAIDGKSRKVLLQASKNGFFYVIDRSTGKLISAEPFVPTTWAKRVDFNTGRPVEEPHARANGAQAAVIRPSSNGAHSWPPMSYNPDTGLVYIPAIDLDQYYSARGVDLTTWMQKPFTEWLGYSDVIGRDDIPQAPQAGGAESGSDNVFGNDSAAWLQARDPRSNTTIWRVKQPGLWSGGTLTTRGGLVFIGQANGAFVAYDAKTGKELWIFNAERPISAPPISYAIDGLQYVSVLVGWGGTPGNEGALGDPAVRMNYRDGGRRLLTFAIGGPATLQNSPSNPIEPIDVAGFVPDPAKVARGERIFDVTCNLCHGTDARSGGGAPDLRGSTLASDPNTLRQIVLGGTLELRGMPQYTDFSQDDVDSLYHYIRFRARQDLKHTDRSPASQ